MIVVLFFSKWRGPTLPGSVPPSTIGARELNYCVRDGNRCILSAILTTLKVRTLKTEQQLTHTAFFLKNHWSSVRPISIGQLHILLCLHLRPINVVVSHEPYPKGRRSSLAAGFALRCFQRLSRPYVATQRCSWQNNWYTRGMSIPVLSY